MRSLASLRGPSVAHPGAGGDALDAGPAAVWRSPGCTGIPGCGVGSMSPRSARGSPRPRRRSMRCSHCSGRREIARRAPRSSASGYHQSTGTNASGRLSATQAIHAGDRQPRQLHPARLPGAGGAADAV